MDSFKEYIASSLNPRDHDGRMPAGNDFESAIIEVIRGDCRKGPIV